MVLVREGYSYWKVEGQEAGVNLPKGGTAVVVIMAVVKLNQ